MPYNGIDKCDQCGKPLEEGQWLIGLCRACERKPVAAGKKGKKGKR
ncbi:MAG: hypothetical protein ACE5IQ_10345 [Candidatus Methylomirabilales bacterium]